MTPFNTFIRFCGILTLALIFSVFGLSLVVAQSSITPLPKEPPAPKMQRIIIKYRSGVSGKVQEEITAKIRAQKRERLKLPGTEVYDVKNQELGSVFKKLAAEPGVDYAEADAIATKSETPNDPKFSLQWGLFKIQSPQAWDKTHGGTTVDTAIVDTGIDESHPDLQGNVVARANFTTDPDADGDGHGTHVAGIAGATTNNALGIAGTSYLGRLMSVKVLDNHGSGYYSWIANGIVWAADNGAEVINLSLSGTSPSVTLQNALAYAWNKGVVIVAAAGNGGNSRENYPAYYTQAIAVAATDQNDKKAWFSSYGSWVDLAAPGVSILSSYKGNYSYLSGTSMSTPFVSGLAALLKGYHGEWTNAQIRTKLESSADHINGTGSYWTSGRINACRAVDCQGAVPPTPSPTPTPTPTTPPALTPTSTPTPKPTVSPIPSPRPTPTWCKYIPNHRFCK